MRRALEPSPEVCTGIRTISVREDPLWADDNLPRPQEPQAAEVKFEELQFTRRARLIQQGRQFAVYSHIAQEMFMT